MFITIDGPDGTGKTTLAKGLAQALISDEIPAVYTSEPTDTKLGKYIRKVLREGGADLPRLTELFIEDRANHIQDFILPQSRRGKVVICDRYKYSTVCYQHLQGEPISRLIDLNKPFVSPDIAFILMVNSPDVLLNRIGSRGKERDLFETRSFMEKSIQLYSKMKSFYPKDNIILIDAEQTPEEILSAIKAHVIRKLKRAPGEITFDQAYVQSLAMA